MKCPCCGVSLGLVSVEPVEPVGVSDVIEPMSTPSPVVREVHGFSEVRWAVKCIKGAKKRLFFQNAEIKGARTVCGALHVEVGSYLLVVRRWAEVVDRKGVPFLVES